MNIVETGIFLKHAIEQDNGGLGDWDFFRCRGCGATWRNRERETGVSSTTQGAIQVLAFSKISHRPKSQIPGALIIGTLPHSQQTVVWATGMVGADEQVGTSLCQCLRVLLLRYDH